MQAAMQEGTGEVERGAGGHDAEGRPAELLVLPPREDCAREDRDVAQEEDAVEVRVRCARARNRAPQLLRAGGLRARDDSLRRAVLQAAGGRGMALLHGTFDARPGHGARDAGRGAGAVYPRRLLIRR